jgi:hypothetical protein
LLERDPRNRRRRVRPTPETWDAIVEHDLEIDVLEAAERAASTR